MSSLFFLTFLVAATVSSVSAESGAAPTFRAVSPYGSVEYKVMLDQSIKGRVIFNDLVNVSACHIHSNTTEEPIIVWLATSKAWSRGIAQATPAANAPCCTPGR